MPTYQYACTECAERPEAVQSFSDAALTECPACGGRLRKVFSAVGVVFKGSGFYKNDSRSTKGSSDGSTDKGAGGDKADKGSTDKPAADKGSGANGNGSGDKAAATKAPAASAASSSTSTPAAKSA